MKRVLKPLGKTIIEKIITDHTTENVAPGNIVWMEIDVRTARDFGGVRIRFGNGYFGKKILNTDTIVVTYFETLGSLGNVLTAANITTVESTIYESLGDPITVYCTNPEPVTGGAAEVDTETIRANCCFKSRHREISTRRDSTIFKFGF